MLRARGSDLGFDVASNPEFLKEGAAVADCMRPDRIIIGTSDPESEDLLREVYAPFNRNHDKIIVMDVRSARPAISFMKLIFVASMALAAYLVSSAERTSMTMILSWLRLKGA